MIRGGILMPIGDFPEDLSQTMLVGLLFVGRLGVFTLHRGPEGNLNNTTNNNNNTNNNSNLIIIITIIIIIALSL